MPPRPQNYYNPVPSAPAQVGVGNDYLHVEATPQDAGAQIGAAMEQGGARLEQVGNEASNVAIQQQGLINETMATNAESQFVTQAGAITGKYKSLEGLEAASALPKYTADINNLREQYRQNLPAGALRAYDTLTARHLGYYIGDANGYAAQQIKSADTKSAQDSITLAISQAGNLSVAGDDTRFTGTLRDTDFQMARILQNQGYGPNAGTGMTQDPKTGAITFNDTPQGKQADAAYKSMLDVAHGQAWENRLHVLADQNVLTAYNTYQNNRDKIPGATQVKLDAFFTPRLRSAQAASTADTVLSNANQSYIATQQPGAKPATSIADAIHAQESGGQSNAPTSANGAVGGWQVKPETFAQYAKPGEVITNPADNEAVAKRIITDLSQKYNGDPARIAVGYFSGPGNVAPAGSPAPWIKDTADANGKTVSSYVADVTGRLGGSAGTPGQQYKTQADYYRANYADIIEQARSQAQSQHPDDPVFASQATARVEQRMNDVIRQQELSYKADADLVTQAFRGDLTKGQRPTTVTQLTNISPEVKSAWDRMWINNPLAAEAVETRILRANSRQDGKDLTTYGPGYYDALKGVTASPGTAGAITDPTKLWTRVGPGGDLTTAGVEKLTQIINGRGTPEKQAETKMQESAIAYAKHQLSFEADYGTFKLRDPKGEDAFNIHFLPAFYQAYDAGRSAGKTPYQLLSKDSPDFIVDKVMAPFKRTPEEMARDRVNSDLEAPPAPAEKGPDLTTEAGVVAAYRSGHFGQGAEARQKAAEALGKIGIKFTMPAPSNPGPSAPLAQ